MTPFRAVSGVVIAAAVVTAVWVGTQPLRTRAGTVLPIAPVRSGEFVAVLRTRGQIQAQRSVPVYAPLVQDLRIAWLAPASEVIQQGDPMIRFDSSTAERDLIERRSTMAQARASLDQAVAEAGASVEHDERDLVDARLGVELAALGTADSDFVARLDAERARIDLRVAEQALRQLDAEVAQRQASREAKLASLRRELEEATAQVEIVEARIARMEVHATLTGFAIYAENRSSVGSSFGGSSAQPYRVGDQVFGGMNLATIPDLTSLLIDVTVEEIDRGRMRVGDEVVIRVDALPELSVPATLTAIAPLAEMSLDTRGRSFHAYAALGAAVDSRIRPGMNGSMDVVIDRIPDARIIPAQALITRGGKPAVHVVESGGYRLVEVEVLARNADEIAVEGVARDARVTLVDPFADGGASASVDAPESSE